MLLRLDDRLIDLLFELFSRQRNSGRYLPTNYTFKAWEKGNDYKEDVKVRCLDDVMKWKLLHAMKRSVLKNFIKDNFTI